MIGCFDFIFTRLKCVYKSTMSQPTISFLEKFSTLQLILNCPIICVLIRSLLKQFSFLSLCLSNLRARLCGPTLHKHALAVVWQDRGDGERAVFIEKKRRPSREAIRTRHANNRNAIHKWEIGIRQQSVFPNETRKSIQPQCSWCKSAMQLFHTRKLLLLEDWCPADWTIFVNIAHEPRDKAMMVQQVGTW